MWQIDALRREALRVISDDGYEPAFKLESGNRVSVSKGDTDYILRHQATVLWKGWHFILSARKEGPLIHWHLSAKLKKQSSSEEDWALIGRVASHLGAPADAALPSDPYAATHWDWFADS